MEQGYTRYSIIEFEYFYVEKNKSNFLFLIENISDIWNISPTCISRAKLYIKTPSWYEMHEIYRKSTIKDVYKEGKTKIDSEKLKDNKIKYLLWKIEDYTGEIFYFDEDDIQQMHPSLALFILKKINELIEKENCYSRITEEEERKLSFECFQYYSSIKKKRLGKQVDIPNPPAIIVLKRVCEMFNCLPDEARQILKEDIDQIFIANEQEYICENPENVGIPVAGNTYNMGGPSENSIETYNMGGSTEE